MPVQKAMLFLVRQGIGMLRAEKPFPFWQQVLVQLERHRRIPALACPESGVMAAAERVGIARAEDLRLDRYQL